MLATCLVFGKEVCLVYPLLLHAYPHVKISIVGCLMNTKCQTLVSFGGRGWAKAFQSTWWWSPSSSSYSGTHSPTVPQQWNPLSDSLGTGTRISWALCPRDSQLQLCPVEHTTKVQGPASPRRLHLSLPTAHQHWGQSVVHWVFISDISYPWLFSLWLRAATPRFSCQEIVPVHGIYRGRLCYMTHSQEISSFMAWHFTLKNVQGWNLKLFSGGWEQRGKFVNSIRIKSSVYRILVDGFIILRYKQL